MDKSYSIHQIYLGLHRLAKSKEGHLLEDPRASTNSIGLGVISYMPELTRYRYSKDTNRAFRKLIKKALDRYDTL